MLGLIVAGSLAGCATPGGAPAPDEPTPALAIERFQRALPLADDARVDIVNRHGDIRVRYAEGGQPLLSAVIQRLDSESRTIDFDVNVDSAGGSIRVRAADDFDGRIDAVVMVPDRVYVAAATDDGLIEIRRPRGDADAESDSGAINLRMDGRVTARTQTGDITYSWRGAGNWQGHSDLESRGGNITITVPNTVRATISAVAGAGIDNRLPATVMKSEPTESGHLRVDTNGGGNEIRARSESGTLTILGY